MKTTRIKGIVIVILALLNAFLFFLLVSRRAQERSAWERSARELTALYESSGIALDRALLPGSVRLAELEPGRDPAAEELFASYLLGEVRTYDAGGGIYRYSGAEGECLIRTGGAVEATLSRAVDDPAAFSAALFEAFGYVRRDSPEEDGAVEGVYTLGSGAVFNAVLRLEFEEGRLVSVSGSFLPAVAVPEGAEETDVFAALARFLDYRNASGAVCTEITALESGYLLQSTTSAALRLTPAWRIGTDVNSYYVNFTSGEIIRG